MEAGWGETKGGQGGAGVEPEHKRFLCREVGGGCKFSALLGQCQGVRLLDCM